MAPAAPAAAAPLLAVPVWVLLRGEHGVVAWSARLLAAAYAVLYGALDAIAGIGARHQVVLAARRAARVPPSRTSTRSATGRRPGVRRERGASTPTGPRGRSRKGRRVPAWLGSFCNVDAP